MLLNYQFLARFILFTFLTYATWVRYPEMTFISLCLPFPGHKLMYSQNVISHYCSADVYILWPFLLWINNKGYSHHTAFTIVIFKVAFTSSANSIHRYWYYRHLPVHPSNNINMFMTLFGVLLTTDTIRLQLSLSTLGQVYLFPDSIKP